MSRPEPRYRREPRDPRAPAPVHPALRSSRHYGRWVGLLGVVIVVSLVLNTIFGAATGSRALAPGARLPPFAVPLVLSSLEGDADVATRAEQGEAGRVPACLERSSQILNICELYGRGPVVLALFVDSGSCRGVLSEMQSLSATFPTVSFAAISIKGNRGGLRSLVHAQGLTYPVGIDRDGAVAALFKVATCPQVDFAYPGGVIQQQALLRTPSAAELERRVAALAEASRSRGTG
jgi:hypothetical protein